MNPVQRHCLSLISLFIIILACGSSLGLSKKIRCHDEECQMRAEHFKVYAMVKQALDQDFSMKGKDLVPWIRSVEVLNRRFGVYNSGSSSSLETNKQQTQQRINGTELVLRLLANEKLRNAMQVFNSEEGRQLVNLYKTSINGNQQNLACSKWRVEEIEFAARRLEQNDKLAGVFANIHKNFVERSARKCLKSSCSSIDDNMNRLESVLRRSARNRRKGFLVHDMPFESVAAGTAPEAESSGDGGGGSSISDEAALIEQLVVEPANEFQPEELELCRFFKRTNATNCQASGNELSEISFVKSVRPTTTTTNTNNDTTTTHNQPIVPANLADYLADYQANSGGKTANDTGSGARQAGESILAQCGAIEPLLGYHLFGLRWYQRQGLISVDKLRARTFWCPGLAYWFELDRLCNEVKATLSARNVGGPRNDSFAY